jgi:hypothetical protein
MKIYYLFFIILSAYLVQSAFSYRTVIKGGRFRAMLEERPSKITFDLVIALLYFANIAMGVREYNGMNSEHITSGIVWLLSAAFAVHRLNEDLDAIKVAANATKDEGAK